MIAAVDAGNILVWIVWLVAAFACLASALAVVSFTNPFYSALALIGNLASLAVMYLLLSAQFVAAAQVLVYAGAVMVMFLFVIAYLGGEADAPWAGGPSWQSLAAVSTALGWVMLACIGGLILRRRSPAIGQLFGLFERGLYVAMATLAFGSIVGTVFQKWTAVTGGFDGFAVPTPTIFGVAVEGATGIYYVSLAVLVFVLWVSANLLRSPAGRAMVAIRDSEVSAQSMGIHLARYKTLVFAISA